MTRAWAVVALFLPAVAVSTAAGVSFEGLNGVSERAQSSLRGRRATERPMCNSIGCPDGYIPIKRASETECRDGRCEVKQCCEAMCACFGCPNYYIPIHSKSQELCRDGVCTKEQCCERPPAVCSDIGCPNGYTPIKRASETKCRNGRCQVEQCCEAKCAGFGCPSGYIPNQRKAEDLCYDGVCGKDQCCERHDGEKRRERQEEKKRHDDDDFDYCSSVRCPSATHKLIDDADRKKCKVVDYMAPTYDSNDDDYTLGGRGGSYSYDYGGWYDNRETREEEDEERWESWVSSGSGRGDKGKDRREERKEDCDVRTCCRKLEYGLWGPE